MARGTIREWHEEEGWGVLDSDETPGGCWVHFSHLRMAGFKSAEPGQAVTFTFEPAQQDGYAFRATDVTIDAAPRVQPDRPLPPGPPYQSQLTIEWHESES